MQFTATRGFRYLSLCSTGPPRIPPPLAHFRALSALSVADATFCGCSLFPVGCSRLGARHHRGGWLFPSRCAPPRSRLAVPVLVPAATVAVGCYRPGARHRCHGWLFPLLSAPPRPRSAVLALVRAVAPATCLIRSLFGALLLSTSTVPGDIVGGSAFLFFFCYFLAISRRHRHVEGSHEVAQGSTYQRRRAHQRRTLPYNSAAALRICLLAILFGWFEFCLSSDGRQQISGCNPRSAARIARSAV